MDIELMVDISGIVIRADYQKVRAIDATFFKEEEIRGRAVLVHTGWDIYWGTEEYFQNHPFLTIAFRPANFGEGLLLHCRSAKASQYS